jgi:hypothetical protein
MTFDTHTFIKRLTEAGMPERQAEVLAEEQANLLSQQLATKADIALLRSEVNGELKLLRWMLALVIATTTLPLIKQFF